MKKSEVFPSKRLRKEDILGPTVATIASIVSEQMQEDSDEHKPVMHFTRADLKPMVLNSGNWDTLELAYGEESNFWIGKPVEIYVDPSVSYKGKRVGGLKVRIPSGVPSNGHAPSTGPLGTSLMNLPMALQALAAVNLTKDDLKRVITSKGFTGYMPRRDTPIVQAMIKEAEENMSQQEQPFDDAPADETIAF